VAAGELDGLGPRIREEGSFNPGMGTGQERLGQESGQQGAVHLDEVGEIPVEGLAQGAGDPPR